MNRCLSTYPCGPLPTFIVTVNTVSNFKLSSWMTSPWRWEHCCSKTLVKNQPTLCNKPEEGRYLQGLYIHHDHIHSNQYLIFNRCTIILHMLCRSESEGVYVSIRSILPTAYYWGEGDWGGGGIYFPQVLPSLTCKISAELEKSFLVFPSI